MQTIKQQAFQYIDKHRDDMLALWQQLVQIESGSANKEGVDAVALKIKQTIDAAGGQAQISELDKAGNMLVGLFGADRKQAAVAFLGHMDTVFSQGTIDKRPFTIKDGKAYGPGVLDMKGGIVILLYAIKALQAAGYDRRPLKIVLAGDEEVGHKDSNTAELIMNEVSGCVAAFNCETGFVDNSIVVGRKGVAGFMMEAHGVAVHVGIEPEKGRSAILELAHKTVAIHNLTNWEEGTTFNVGVIQGGTVPNAAADYARIEIDVRFVKETAGAAIVAQLQELAAKPHVEGTTVTLTRRGMFKPMITTAEVERLFALVAQASDENGLGVLTPAHSGGGSDSAYSVAAGVPTVCSMGVKGGKNHTPDEHAVVESLFERAKLLVASVLKLEEF
ncbi:MAG: M20 family metallopeptidase [Sporomusa sp.]